MSSRFLHREFLFLVALIAAGVAAFLVTRALAASNADLRARDAQEWHARGRAALDEGDVPAALRALQRAAHIERGNRDVEVLLARALRRAGEDTRAADVLARLRESHPDDADVNTELARLEADRANLSLAIRYYQDALNGLWAPAQADRARTLRTEFIQLLLRHGERARALSQTLVLAADLPAEQPWQLTVARFFLQAGDPRRALDRFGDVLSAAPAHGEALAGAGEASFVLGEYARARRYLAAAPPNPQVADMRAVADAVLTADPLAARLTQTERRRRVAAILQRAAARLDACPGGGADDRLGDLARQVDELRTPARRARSAGGEFERAENGVALAFAVERETEACGPREPLDRAIVILARLHDVAEGR